MPTSILLGTRKGTVIINRDANGWKAQPICHQGIPVCYAARDPRDGTLWAALDHGHWGPKLSRSRDDGKTWEDVLPLSFDENNRYFRRLFSYPHFIDTYKKC